MKLKHILFISIVFIFESVSSQTTISGQVLDYETNIPIDDASILLECDSSVLCKTDANGNFSINITSNTLPEITDESVTYSCKTLTSNGIYLNEFEMTQSSQHHFHKVTIDENRNFIVCENKSPIYSCLLKNDDTCKKIIIKKNGYREKTISINEVNIIKLIPLSLYQIDYVTQIPDKTIFQILQSDPLLNDWGEVQAIKLIYNFKTNSIYYVNANKFTYHYEFASEILGYTQSGYEFSSTQYQDNPDRIYYLGNISYYPNIQKYTLDFFPGDEIKCEEIAVLYEKIQASTYFKDSLYLLTNNLKWSNCNVPKVQQDEIIENKNFISMNNAKNYGYLRDSEYPLSQITLHDIIILDILPNSIPIVGGVISKEYQTPLCHINVLSHNRRTPNMVLRNVNSNESVQSLINELVFFEVLIDTFYLRKASIADAQQFWNSNENKTPVSLSIDSITTDLILFENNENYGIETIGGKANNFSILYSCNTSPLPPLPTPELSFAIPFSYYLDHIKNYGLDKLIDTYLNNDLFLSNYQIRDNLLKILRDSIIKSPISSNLISLVTNYVNSKNSYTNIRFRSSTNAEDVEGFNGAGLYESHTGYLNDNDESFELAIKKVWASLWNIRAFDEREYFKINQKSVAMGILAHRSFPDELANGVLITKNVYANYSAFVINAQYGDISVVQQNSNIVPDILIVYNLPYYPDLHKCIEYIRRSTLSDEDQTVLTNEEVILLFDYCTKVITSFMQKGYNGYLDFEFKIDLVNNERKLYIKQVRPY